MNRRLVCHQSVGGLCFSDVNRLMEEMEKEMSEAIRGIPEVKVAYDISFSVSSINRLTSEKQSPPTD